MTYKLKKCTEETTALSRIIDGKDDFFFEVQG